jgi:hypothetical protein
MQWGKLNRLRGSYKKSFHETSLCGLNSALYDAQLLISEVKCRCFKKPAAYILCAEEGDKRFLETLVATNVYGVIFVNNQLDGQFFFIAARNM